MKLTRKEKNDISNALGLFTHIGVSMSICIIGCILIGRFIDTKLNTQPLFLIIFILLGVASAIFTMFKIVTSTWKK